MFPGLPNPSKPVSDNDIMDAYLQLRKQTGSRSSSPTKSLSKPAALPKALKPIQISHQAKLDTETASLATEHRFTEHMYDLFGELEHDPIFGEDGLLRTDGSLQQASSPLKVPLGKEVGITDLIPSRFSTTSSPSPYSTSSGGLKTKDPLDIYLESAYSALDTVNTFDSSAADVLYRVIKWLVTDARVKPEEVARHKEAAAHALALVADREKVIEALTKEKNTAVSELKALRKQVKDSESIAIQLQLDLDSSRAEVRTHMEKISLLQADLIAEEKKFYDMKIERNKLAHRNTELVTTGVELRTQIEEFIKVQKDYTSHDEEYTMEIKKLKNELEHFKEQYDDDIVAYQQIVGSKTELIADLTMQCNTAQNEVMILKDKLAYMQNCIMANKAVSSQGLKDGSLVGSLTNLADQSTKTNKGTDDQSDALQHAGAAKKRSKPTRGVSIQVGGDRDGFCTIAGEDTEESESYSFIRNRTGDAGADSQLLDLPALAAFLSKQSRAEELKLNTIIDNGSTSSPSKQPGVALNVIKRKVQLFINQISKYKELLTKFAKTENTAVDLDVDSDPELHLTPRSYLTKSPNDSPSKKTLHGASSSSDAQLRTDDIKTLQAIQAILGETFTLDDLITNEELLRIVGEAKLNLLLGKLRQRGCSTFNASGLLSEASTGENADSKLSTGKHPLPPREHEKDQSFAATNSNVKTSKKTGQKATPAAEQSTRKKAPSFPQKAPTHTASRNVQKNTSNRTTIHDGKLPQDEASQLLVDGRLEGQMLQKLNDISQIDANLNQGNESTVEEGRLVNHLPSDITEETPVYGYTSATGASSIFDADTAGSHEHIAKGNSDKNMAERRSNSVLYNRISTTTSTSQQKPVTAIATTGSRAANQDVMDEIRKPVKDLPEPPARLQTPQDQQRQVASPDAKQQTMYTVTTRQDSQLLTGMVVKATGPLVSETPTRVKGTPSVQLGKSTSRIYKSHIRMLNDQLVFTPGRPLKNVGRAEDYQDSSNESGSSSYSSSSTDSHFEDTGPLEGDLAGNLVDGMTVSPVRKNHGDGRVHRRNGHNSRKHTKTEKEGVLIQIQGKNAKKSSYTYLQTKNEKAMQYDPPLESSRAFSEIMRTTSHIYDSHFEDALMVKSKQAMERIKSRALSGQTRLQMADIDHSYSMPSNSILQGSQLFKRQQSELNLCKGSEKPANSTAASLFDGTIPQVDGVTSVAKKMIDTKTADNNYEKDVSMSDLDLSGLRTYDTGSFVSNKSVIDKNDQLADIAQRAVKNFRLVGKSMQVDSTPPLTADAVTEMPIRDEPIKNTEPALSQQQPLPGEQQESTAAVGDVHQFSQDTSAPKPVVGQKPARTENLISQANSLLKKTAPILVRTFDSDPFSLNQGTEDNGIGKRSSTSDINTVLSLGMPRDEKSFEQLRTAISELVAKNIALHDEVEMMRKQLSNARAAGTVRPILSISTSCQSDPNMATTALPMKMSAEAVTTTAFAADSSHPKRQELRSFYPPRASDAPVQHPDNNLLSQQPITSVSPPTNSFVEIKSHEGSVDPSLTPQSEADQTTVNVDLPREERVGSAVVKRRIGYEVLTHVAQVAHEPFIKPNKDIIHQSELYAYPLVDPSAEKTADGGFGASLTYDTALSLAKSSINKSIIVTNKTAGSPKHLAEHDNPMKIDHNSDHVLVLSDGSEEEFHQISENQAANAFKCNSKEHQTNRILFRNHVKPLLGEYSPIKHGNGSTANDSPCIKNVTSARSAALPVLVTDTKAAVLRARPHRSTSASTAIQSAALQLFPTEDVDVSNNYLVRTGSCKAVLMTTQNEEPLCSNYPEKLDTNMGIDVDSQKFNPISDRFLQGLPPPVHGRMQVIDSENENVAAGASLKYNPCMQKRVVSYGNLQTSRIHIQDHCEVVPADLLYKEPTDEDITRQCIRQSAQEKLDGVVHNRNNVAAEQPAKLKSQRSSPKQSPPRSISPSVTTMNKNETSTEPRLYINAPLSPMRMFPQQKDEEVHQNLRSKRMSHPGAFTRKDDDHNSFQTPSPQRYASKRRTESSFSLALKKEELRQRNELAKHIHVLEAELALERQRVEMAQANPMMISCNYNPSSYPSAFFQVNDGFKTVMIKNLKSKPTARLLLRVGSNSLEQNDASSMRAPAVSRSKDQVYIPPVPVAIPLFEPTEAHQGLAIDVKKEQNPDINEYVGFNNSFTYAAALDCLLHEVPPLPPSIYNNTLASSAFLQSYVTKFPELVEMRRIQASAENALTLVPASCPATELGGYIRDYRASDPQTHTYSLSVGDKVAMVFYKQEVAADGHGRAVESTPDPTIQFLVTNTPDLQLLRYNNTAIYVLTPCHIKIKSTSWLLRLIRVLFEEIASQGQVSALAERNMPIKRIHLWAKKKYGLQPLITNLLWHLYCSTLFHRHANAEIEFFARVLCGGYDADQLNFYLSLRDPLTLSAAFQDKTKEICDNGEPSAASPAIDKAQHIITLSGAFSTADKLFPMLSSADAYEVFGAILDNSTLVADSKDIFKTTMRTHINTVKDSPDKASSMQSLSVPVGTLETYVFIHILLSIYTSRRTVFNMRLIDLFEANASGAGPKAGLNLDDGLEILQKAWPYLHRDTILSLVQKKNPNSSATQILHFEEFVELLAGLLITPPATIDPLLLQARAGFAAAEQRAVKLISLLDEDIPNDAALLQALDSLRQDAIAALQRHCSLKANVVVAEYLRLAESEGMQRGFAEEYADTSKEVE